MDWQPGDGFEVQVVCEWTAVDGRRLRQVSSVAQLGFDGAKGSMEHGKKTSRELWSR
jgi:hypothetical protein